MWDERLTLQHDFEWFYLTILQMKWGLFLNMNNLIYYLLVFIILDNKLPQVFWVKLGYVTPGSQNNVFSTL